MVLRATREGSGAVILDKREAVALKLVCVICFFFQAEDGIRDLIVTGVQTCALPISRQLWHWIYHRGATDFAEMTNLAKGFRERLAARYALGRPAVSRALASSDGTRKWRSEERRVGKECRSRWSPDH